jgi:uncharacterized protein YutE (UPF0331/DUF86 family)
MKKIIDAFPKPLLQDLIEGHWLPVIGAGLSRNATVPTGKKMPLWDDLGKTLPGEISDYPYSGTLDSISAYAHEYSRTRLIEKLTGLLLIDRARPSNVHRAFCSIPFDIVCTTNFDFLLERQYESGPRHCRIVIDEDQLSISPQNTELTLLKLHGDLNHPQRLVVTEEDYDKFITRYPLLATYLANLLITRTAVLIGYSLDDPDFRQVWGVIGERLGKQRRFAYALMVDARPAEISRYERRGVKVINLPGSRTKYGEVLASAFDELREYLTTNVIPASQVTEEDPLKELSLPRDAINRLCFFAVPFSLRSFYKERVYPIVQRHGFVPVTADEIVSPGDYVAAKIEALIERATVIVVDASSPATLMEMRLALTKAKSTRVLLIADKGTSIPSDLRQVTYLVRPSKPFDGADQFLEQIASWFQRLADDLRPQLTEEPSRLLELREYRAAVISAITLLESVLRDRYDIISEPSSKLVSVGRLINQMMNLEMFEPNTVEKVKKWLTVRNSVVHTQQQVSAKTSREIVTGILEIIRRIREQ